MVDDDTFFGREKPTRSLIVDDLHMNFIYRKLPEEPRTIRLVHIAPGNPSDVVRCKLFESSVGATPPYKALSYSWKTNRNIHEMTIICNGQLLRVSTNLNCALRRLRHPTRVVTLWVDSICINQADNSERTQQVGIMRDIYENSCETIIWLGEREARDDMGDGYQKNGLHSSTRECGSRGSDCSHDTNDKDVEDDDEPSVEWYGDDSDNQRVSFYNILYDSPYKYSPELDPQPNDVYGAFCLIHVLSRGCTSVDLEFFQHDVLLVDNKKSRVANGLWAILERPWWRRAWVVQETVVAPKSTIMYGNISAPWTMFSTAATNYALDGMLQDVDVMGSTLTRDPITSFSRTVLEIENTRTDWTSPQPTTLLPLLRKFRSREATDARDKVFALLGLVQNWQLSTPLLPNYNLMKKQVFWETTTKIIESTRSLSALIGALGEPNANDQVRPSWVTDWSFRPEVDEFERLSRTEMYDAASGLLGSVRLHSHHLLEVKGFYVDEIVSFGSELPSEGVNRQRVVVSEWSNLLEENDQQLQSPPVSNPSPLTPSWLSKSFRRKSQQVDQRNEGNEYNENTLGGSREDTFWRTICADTLYVGDFYKARGVKQGNYGRAHSSGLDAFRLWQFRRNDSYRMTSLHGRLMKLPRELPEESKSKNSFYFAMASATASRKFFITQKGHIGTGPASIQKGDQIFITLGCRVPLILRPNSIIRYYNPNGVETLIPDQQERCEGLQLRAGQFSCHSLIGDAYLHGFMDGEMIDLAKQSSTLPSSICLV